MTKLFFAFFAFAVTVQAQAPQKDLPILGYTQDINLDGKAYERYQTPQGDNVLISKAAAEKRGVHLFTYARQVIAREGLFHVGVFGFSNMNINKDQALAKRAELAAQAGRPLTPQEYYDLSAMEWPGQVSGRLPFYRHLRGTAAIGFGESPENSDTGIRPGGMSYHIAFDHDLIVIPVPRSFIAFSAGYFRSSQGMDFGFKEADGTSTKIRSSIVSTGPTFTLRYTFGDFDEGQTGKSGSISMEVTYQKGSNGNSRTLTGISWGFGGSHGPLKEQR